MASNGEEARGRAGQARSRVKRCNRPNAPQKAGAFRLASRKESRPRENELQTETIIVTRADGVRLGDTKEGKDRGSSLAKRVSERRRHQAGWLQTRETRRKAKEMRRQGPSEAKKEESEVEKVKSTRKGRWRGGLYLCCGALGWHDVGRSGVAPCPIGRAAKPGGCSTVFAITLLIYKLTRLTITS